VLSGVVEYQKIVGMIMGMVMAAYVVLWKKKYSKLSYSFMDLASQK
jgi:hypothetical protein